MRALHACPVPGCPALLPAATARCPVHARAHTRARGSRQARGYDADHDRERKAWAARLARGPWPCSRCGRPVRADQPWHLDHRDDRTGWLGPAHAACNTSAGGRAAHG